ncbi:MAG: 3D domain-containing protein [Gemmatirosa sp.]|nr:3D domain-containing protein [Gemmatirosa sp.]
MTRRAAASRRRRPTALTMVAWGALAAIVAVGQALRVPEPDDDTLEPTPVVIVPPSPADSGVPSVPPPAPSPAPAPSPSPSPSPAPSPAPPPKPVTHRELPRPFAALRRFESPLITPRLHLPRALVPKLSSLTALLAHARPGEPMAVMLTAYCIDGQTRRGNPTRTGIIAADPRIFPFARHVELFSGGRYLGRFLVDDTGSHVKGPRIDIWTPDCEDARRFGSRPGVATLLAAGSR